MNCLVIGGTGFIGYHTVLELLRRGHKVSVLALPPLPQENLLPPEVVVHLRNLDDLSDKDVLTLLDGQEAVVFAAGADDRTIPNAPAYPYFYNANVRSSVRLFTLARAAGVRRGVLIGSYFSHFDGFWPELELTRHHPYIRSRQEQARQALDAAMPDLELMVLELPYIFGAMPGRVPLWAPLIAYVRSPFPLFYSRGGTNAIAISHVAEAIAGAIERGKAGEKYLIGEENLPWADLLGRLAHLAGHDKKVITLPTGMLRLTMRLVHIFHKWHGKEPGLDPVEFIRLQTADTFFDPAPSRVALGYGYGGLDAALSETIHACLPHTEK
jgi:dihydroflavonol-4-reductase